MCYDGEAPSVFDGETRTARKEHKCCECGVTIGRGEKYAHAWGVWDGEAASYARCSACDEKADILEFSESAMGCRGVEASVPYGELMQAWHDYQRDYGYSPPVVKHEGTIAMGVA